MGYGRALLMRDVKKEEEELQKKAKKKSLWGSIGRTIGGLGAMALTGGAVNPVTLGLLTGGASFLGGAAGAKLSGTGDLSKQGKFFKSDREDIQKELGAFGTTNLMSSLKSGLTAGIGQKLKLMKAGKEGAKLSEGFGLDFKDSFVGKTKFGKDIISKADKRTSVISYGGGGTGIDTSIKSTGNEFIDRKLGGYVELPAASIYPDTRYGEYRKRLVEADTPINRRWQQTLFSGE